MDYDEMKRRVDAIESFTKEIDHCHYLRKMLRDKKCEIVVLSQGPVAYSSIPPWLNTLLIVTAEGGLRQQVQRLHDNIKIIEEISDNVRLTAEATPANEEEEPANQIVTNAGETD